MRIDSTSVAPTLRTLAVAAMLATGVAAYSPATRGQTATLPSTGTIAVPTYESAGLYWQSPGGSAGCEVKYRKAGEASWSQGLAMWYDARDSQCRGSLVGLTPNTSYEVELNLPGQAATHGLVFKTWSNQLPVAKTIAVNGGSATLDVTEGGSAGGYVVYDGRGATLDAQNNAQHNVTINASYVIVRGLNLKGAKADAIRISPTVTDVVIEDNDISGWGRQRSGNWGVDMDSAVRAVCTQPTLMRVTVQRNKIHDPRYSANSWSDGHPAGPQAIAFAHCGGNHVFRHNEAYSTNGNYFNDIIGGEDNFTKAGFPNSDTDIYGNRLSHAWDDAIEAEGANENVRIWGNYIDRTAIGVATTATSVGPVYIFRNVWNRSQFYERAALDSDDRQPFFKSGGTLELGHGRRYVFHNTMLQAQQSGLQYGLGGGFGLGGTGSAQLIENTWSRNNIYHQWKEGKGFTYQTGSTSSFVADMYNGTAGDATVTSGIVGTPVYATGHGWQSESGGNYQLASSSPGFGRGVRIANFNDGAAAPDVGAHQSGTPAMKFGIAGSPGSSISGATAPTTPTASNTPSITLGSTANPSTVGQYVTYTAVVSGSSGTPTGTIVFRDNGTIVNGCGGLVMANGRASCTIGNQALGTHAMTAEYSGNGIYSGITSSTLPQVVNAAKANTPSITLGSSVNPSTVGQYVELTAVVSGAAGTPTGTLAFLDNGETINGCGGVPIANGRATCTPGSLTLGTNSITTVYSGDGTYNGVTSSTLPQTVGAAKANTPSFTLGSSESPSIAGNMVAFTAVLSGPAGTPTGNVVFRDNGQTISGCGGLTLVNGRASCSPRLNSVGMHSITAIYLGDGNYNGITSSVVPQNVQ